MAAVEALKTCEHFESILKGTFGPNGLDVLLKSTSGNILITNSGSLIFGSLSVDHPVGRMVVDCVRSMCGTTGSGASYFIIVITNILREISRMTGLEKLNNHQEISSIARLELTELSKAFSKLEHELFDEIFMTVLEKLAVRAEGTEKDPSTIKEKLKNVIGTSINGRFPLRIRMLFTQLLVDFLLFSCPFDDMFQFVLDTIDSFSEICIECQGAPQDMSHVVKGVMIPQQFVTDTKELNGQPNFKFLALTFSLEETTCLTQATFSIKSHKKLDQALSWKRVTVLKILQFFKEQEIKLIVTTEAVLDMTLHFCNQLGIAVVAMVPSESVNHLCKYAGIEPLPDLNLEESVIPQMFIGRAKSCSHKILGTKKYTHIILDEDYSPGPKAHQILLYGPAEGLCRQYYLAMLDALKTVRMSFAADKQELLLLPSCGVVEVALSVELQSYSKSTQNTGLSSACRVLAKSLLQIPKTLLSNSNAVASGGKHFLQLRQVIESQWKESLPLQGIDGRTGHVIDPYVRGFLEPLHAKTLLLHDLLQCMSQILRVDRIVGVRRIPKKQPDEDGFESSDSN